MANSVLQEYLTLQFIPMDDQAGVDKLIKSAGVIEKKLRKDKSLISLYTLVALDPETPADDPVLQEVQGIITQNWSVYVNKAGGSNLVTYNRAVILEVLSTLSKEIELAGIIWLTGSPVIKYFSLGREEKVLQKWLLEIGNSFESAARSLWAVNDLELKTDYPAVKAIAPELKSYSPNKDALKKGLSSAAGPNYIDDAGNNAAGDTANRWWSNQNANWAGDFGRIAADAIYNGITAVLNANNKEISAFLKQTDENMTAYVTHMEPYFKQLSGSFLNKSNSLDKRSQLLWIKESQYSLSLNQSYREIEKVVLPFAIAKDLTDIVQPIYPASVDYFAKEIARVSTPEINEAQPISEVLSEIKKSNTIQRFLPAPSERLGKKSLIGYISALVNGKTDVDSLTVTTGIPADASISKADLTSWLIHDIQSHKLTTTK